MYVETAAARTYEVPDCTFESFSYIRASVTKVKVKLSLCISLN